jgi:hypothetical protein
MEIHDEDLAKRLAEETTAIGIHRRITSSRVANNIFRRAAEATCANGLCGNDNETCDNIDDGGGGCSCMSSCMPDACFSYCIPI